MGSPYPVLQGLGWTVIELVSFELSLVIIVVGVVQLVDLGVTCRRAETFSSTRGFAGQEAGEHR